MGVNGTGKSTVIRSLLLLKQSLLMGSLDHGYVNLIGGLCRIGTGVDLLNESAGTDDRIGISLLDNECGDLRVELKYQSDADRLELAEPVSTTRLSEIFGVGFNYLAAERLGPRLISPRGSADAMSGNVGVQGEGALAVLELHRDHLLHESDPRKISHIGSSIGDHVQYYLSQVSPGVRFKLTAYSGLDGIGLGFSSVSQGSLETSTFRPTNVGFGISYSLPIIVACLTASRGSMLLVENPEAHLHTLGQRSMAGLLAKTASAGVQVIVETHSREFYHWLRNNAAEGNINGEDCCLHYFTSGPGGPCVHTLAPVNGPLTDWPIQFFDEFGRPTDLIAPVPP
jgi:predicted ATPase